MFVIVISFETEYLSKPIFIYLFLFTGMGRCVNVQQNLTPLLFNKNDMAEITCIYDDSGKPNMLWYQQKDTAMALIPSYEDGFKGRFELKRKDTLNGALEIPDLSLSDSAVYYCADSMHKLSINKLEKKSNLCYLFEKGTQIFSCKLKSNALLY
uniref:Ig-like domain-containing protein n=1 Tax=Sinocyclocheilus anshuiensis TaxID=1608454 RepID=A0A671RV54_9TELE